MFLTYRIIAEGCRFSWIGNDGRIPGDTMEQLYLRLLQLLWLVVVAYLIAETRHLRKPKQRSGALILLTLFAGGLAVRWLLASFGPGDLRNNMAHVLRALETDYLDMGSAPAAIYDLLLVGLPMHHHTIVYTNLILGALSPLLLVGLASALGFSRRVSLFGGIALAAMPLPILFAGTGARQSIQLFLFVFCLWTVARYHLTASRTPLMVSLGSLLLLLQTRPESVVFALCWLFFLLLSTKSAQIPTRQTVALFSISTLFIVIHQLAISLTYDSMSGLDLLNDVTAFTTKGWLFPGSHRVLVTLNTEYTPHITTLLVGASTLYMLHKKEFMFVSWIVLSFALFSFVFLVMPTHPDTLADARYQVPTYVVLVLYCLPGMEAFVAVAGSRREWLVWVTVAILSLPSLLSFRYLVEERGMDQEYHFILSTLEALPDDAEIYFSHPDHHWDGTLELELNPIETDFGLLLGRGRASQGPVWLPYPPMTPANGRPRYYYHSANCSVVPQAKYFEVFNSKHALDWLSADAEAAFNRHIFECEWALMQHGEHAVRETIISGRSYARARYSRMRVPIGFYQISEDYR